MFEEETTRADPNAAHPDPVEAVKAVASTKAGDEARPDSGGVLTDDAMRHDTPPHDENGNGNENGGGDDAYGEFEWPDGYAGDPKALARFVPIARELGLPKEGAERLARLYAELDQDRESERARFIADNNAQWLGEIRAHPEFGGRNLGPTADNVAAMMRRYGTPMLMAQIRQMNVQNWPEMFYFLARVSQAVTEDRSPSGADAPPPAKSTAQLLFPGLK